MGASESTGRLNETETEEERRRRGETGGSSTGAAAIAIATAGAAVAAWGISRMLSDTEEKDEARMIRTHDQGAFRNREVDQTRTKYFGSDSTTLLLDLYKPTPEDIMLTNKKVWFPPPSNRLKMNTAGGFRHLEPGQPSGYAGIVQDHIGAYMKAFRVFCATGVIDPLEAQIIGILKGLEFLDELGPKGLGAILENDSHEAVCWINGEDKSYYIPKEKMAHCREMIATCRKLADKNKIAVLQIHGKANERAHELVSLAIDERKSMRPK